MHHSEIKDYWDQELAKISDVIDKQCEIRLRELASQLSRFRFNRLLMGMGAWTVESPILDYIDERDEEEVEWDANDLFNWLTIDQSRGSIYKPNISEDEIEWLCEFQDLCDWWLEKTGGRDIVFPFSITTTKRQ